MKPVVLIQCRFSSNRLPGKALLPVAGIPSAILCARRAANTGLNVKIVTSTDPTDDALCERLKAEDVHYYRGDLENVLKRFVDALSSVDDETPVVRLTADNLFVDGALIEEALTAFQKDDKGFLTLHPPALTKTPYGLSVEIFRVKALRDANSGTLSENDCEHVTPWIIRKYGLNTYSPKDLKPGQAHLRCTMDTWNDYQKILEVFRKVSDPIKATWQELSDQLHIIGPEFGIPQRYTKKGNISELSLGTVQLGLQYGIANVNGKPTSEEAKTLVHRAISLGVTHFDCAAAYGEAEQRLGQIIDRNYQPQVTIVTKLSPLTQLAEDASAQEINAHVEASIYKSCYDLNMTVLPYLLLHRWKHRTSHLGKIWSRIKQFQQEGVIKNIGASVQNPKEALQAIADPDIKFIQLPFNLFESRFLKSNFPNEVKAREDVIIQTRSVFLQGLLLSPIEIWPKFSGLNTHAVIDQLNNFTKMFGRESIADLCIAYARSQNWIDCLVIGIENIQQLDHNVELFQKPPLTADECAKIENAFSNLPEQLLNPALWNKEKEYTT